MAVLSGIVCLVAILFFSDVFCAPEKGVRMITVPESEHFCTKVMSGRFEHIQLMSIGHDAISEGSDRVLYEARPDNYSMVLDGTYWVGQKGDGLATNEATHELVLPYKIENDTATGYVIRKDNHTGNFIIYDFVYKDNGSDSESSDSLNPKESILNEAFYFMEKTNNPHEIRLVHRDLANESSSDRQLFRGTLPSGFQYAGSQYLFDGSLGCVYVIQDFEFDLTQQFEAGKVDIRLARLNIPYERYFKCPAKYSKLAPDFAKLYRADRCDSVIGLDDGKPPVELDWACGLFWDLVWSLIVAAFVLALFFISSKFYLVHLTSTTVHRRTIMKQRPGTCSESANRSNSSWTTSGTTTSSGIIVL